jgi:hypothetical protein
MHDSGYMTVKRKPLATGLYGKENALPHKRVRKALAPSWSTPGMMSVTDLSFSETPVSPTSMILTSIVQIFLSVPRILIISNAFKSWIIPYFTHQTQIFKPQIPEKQRKLQIFLI